jgi:hypothetical protein
MCIYTYTHIHTHTHRFYASAHDFAADVRLSLNNAITDSPDTNESSSKTNESTSSKKLPLHAAAERLLRSFEANFKKLQLPRPPPSPVSSSSKRAKVKRSMSAGVGEDGSGGGGGGIMEAGQNETFRCSTMRWLCPHHRCVASTRS